MIADEQVVRLCFVLCGNALGDADNEPDAGRRRFEDRVSGELRWHGDE